MEYRRRAHEPHQALDTPLMHGMGFAPHMPRHLPGLMERRLREQPVDQRHELEVHRRLARRSGAWAFVTKNPWPQPVP